MMSRQLEEIYRELRLKLEISITMRLVLKSKYLKFSSFLKMKIVMRVNYDIFI